ncbi:MAG: DUF952 domain-containing protein [Pyrinomonadaceae bacterium]|nr:DUF952 domain-containing protein [Blastocatellia bacterium]MDQ3221176.1 DUF952 domain-containing protein [Acidobacteriota bacterium]
MLIYHIVLPAIWENFKNRDFYEAESLESEGFIHCSFAGQLDAVLERYYSGAQHVFILSVNTEKLSSRLVEEPSTNGEIFPHIYGKINRDAIIAIDARTLC